MDDGCEVWRQARLGGLPTTNPRGVHQSPARVLPYQGRPFTTKD
ncbi:MAG: hypothetical protein ACHBN1_10355 [Heteroscytonema crispum UTEX LB 1556]